MQEKQRKKERVKRRERWVHGLLKYNIILCEVCCDGCHWQLNTGEMLRSEIKDEREREREIIIDYKKCNKKSDGGK